MLSKRSEELLEWLSKHEQWMSVTEIKQKYKKFDARAFKELTNIKFVDIRLSDGDGEWCEYRINGSGLGHLREESRSIQGNVREWLTFAISVLALALSIISIILQYMKL